MGRFSCCRQANRKISAAEEVDLISSYFVGGADARSDSTSWTFLIAVILIALAFDFANGFNDAANAIATVVSTRVMSPLVAVTMAGGMNFLGALSGTAVAKAVGKGVVDPDSVTLVVVMGGVAAAATWVFLASRMGLPVSGSHSLIAGVAGAGIAHHGGPGVLVGSGILKIVLGLAFSPLLGLTGGFAIMLTIYWVFRHVSPAMVTAIFSTMRPVHGFAAESAAATVIEVATRIGIPVSTTHVITSTILGMGSTRRLSAVRWGVARGIVYAWVLTFPICGVLGAGLYLLVNLATKS